MPSKIIDFGAERGRHEPFFGREDVLAEIERRLADDSPRDRAVVVTGGHGMGKSAILSRWLALEEQRGRKMPHHFFRRGVMDWDRPEAAARSLAAQIEALYPAQKAPAELSASPLGRLFSRMHGVPSDDLAARGQRLVLVLDGLDEARGWVEDHFSALLCCPPQVRLLCSASHPLPRWLRGRECIDLDASTWTSSNQRVCRAFWADQAPRFTPALDDRVVEEAVALENPLWSVLLRHWLEDQPAEQRRVERLPRRMPAGIWQQLQSLPGDRFGLIADGLGLLCAAREALPVEEIEAVLAWKDRGVSESFVHATRALLLEEPASWRGARAYRLRHEIFRDFVAERLGPERMVELHRRLLETTARWPVDEAASELRRRYAARHAIAHALAAGALEQARGLCRDLGLLEALCREEGPFAVHEALRDGAAELWDSRIDLLCQAVGDGARWLHEAPEALPKLVYDRFRADGWEAERIARALHFPRGVPTLRLHRPAQRWIWEERTISGHSARVTACAISPDAKRVVSTSADATLRVWDLATGQLVATLEGHTAPVTSCAFSPDGQRIVSVSFDGSAGGVLKVWDIETGQLLSTSEGPSPWSHARELRTDGRHVISSTGEFLGATLRIWDLATGQLRFTMERHCGRVGACAITPDGQRVIAVTCHGPLEVRDLATGQLLFDLKGHFSWADVCVISPDGQRAVSACRGFVASPSPTIEVWDLAARRRLFFLGYHHDFIWEGHRDAVLDGAISPDGRLLVTASLDGTLKVWDLATGRLLSTLEDRSVACCAISPDGQRVVSASDDGLRVGYLLAGQHLSTIEGTSHGIACCAISPDGQRVVSASRARTLRVWDAVTGQLLSTLHGHASLVTACAMSADGRRVVSASTDRTLRVWDALTGQLLSTFEGRAGPVTSCAASPDGRRAISACLDGTLEVWDLSTGQQLSTLGGHAGPVTSCAISPDGRRVVSASADRTLRVWDLSTGQQLSTLEGHAGPVTSCATSPDGRRVVSASLDGTLKVWDLSTGQLLSTLEGHAGPVTSCAISPDGRRIVSCSTDGALKVWDATTGACLETAHGDRAFHCVSASQELLCAGDEGGDLRIFELASPTPPEGGAVTARPVRLVVYYSSEDEALRDELATHLALLTGEGLLETWYDRRIHSGTREIDRRVEEADVLLVLASKSLERPTARVWECIVEETGRAVERHDACQARVLPVLLDGHLDPRDELSLPFARLQVLPRNRAPVIRWRDRHQAWADVVNGVRLALEALRERSPT
ncbi:AAA family ATPase [Sorangium sp. So ce233]|uniref:AAA family ATPase n=1 Tax=Sorangium sp. So ce233 TaxID=3133290 RepID=UPI003F630BB6